MSFCNFPMSQHPPQYISDLPLYTPSELLPAYKQQPRQSNKHTSTPTFPLTRIAPYCLTHLLSIAVVFLKQSFTKPPPSFKPKAPTLHLTKFEFKPLQNFRHFFFLFRNNLSQDHALEHSWFCKHTDCPFHTRW